MSLLPFCTSFCEWCTAHGYFFIPGETFPTHRTDVRLVNATVVRAYVVGHAVLPLEPLLADGTLKWLLIWVRQLVAIEVINISEGFTTHVTAMVLFHWLGGFLREVLLLLLLLMLHRGHDAGTWRCRCGGCCQDASNGSDIWCVSTDLPGYRGYERNHCGGCLSFLRPWDHLYTCVARLVPS